MHWNDKFVNCLGKKKTVTTYVKKIRMGMVDKPVRQEGEEGDEGEEEGEGVGGGQDDDQHVAR